ncbi:MAG: hypothetical protein KDB06_07010 [Ilumatobacter sp.]|nr:hypothetical protein [Ilumatobacter sp.]MCB0984386.1 hypothetical protein [Ilumatobacter sp.]
MATVQHRGGITPPPTGRLAAWVAWMEHGEPRPVRGPFTRWPRISDVLLAAVVFVASVLAVAVSALPDGADLTWASVRDLPVGAFVLLALSAATLWWRRARPITVTAALLLVMLVWAIAGYGDGQDLVLVVAAYGIGRYVDDPRHGLAATAAILAVSLLGTVIDAHQRVDVLPAVLLTVLPWYVGRRVRNRGGYLALLQERAERLEAEQQARARQAVADERARIARELHDVVTHQVSMMTVQAGAAKTVARDDLDVAIEAMGDVEQAGRQALGELRVLLGVLRPDASDPEQLGPQPGLADVRALTDQLAHTGATVTLTLPALPSSLSAAVDLSAYRIIQESVTNIVKHAGPNPAVEVAVRLEEGALVIDVVNTVAAATPAGPDLPSSGFGIGGMRERATLLGGTLAAAPVPPNHYRVHARLPLEPERS